MGAVGYFCETTKQIAQRVVTGRSLCMRLLPIILIVYPLRAFLIPNCTFAPVASIASVIFTMAISLFRTLFCDTFWPAFDEAEWDKSLFSGIKVGKDVLVE